MEVGAIIDLHTDLYQHLSGLYRRTGCLNAAQAAYWLGNKRAEPVVAPRGHTFPDDLPPSR